jgi:hypothetical protein
MATTDSSAPPRTTTDPSTLAGDPFAYAGGDAHGCYDGWVYLGFETEQDGQEVEVLEAVPCRRCADSR